MEKERKIKSLILIVLIVAVLGLGIAFAALSSSLTINGSAKAQGGSWNIHFAASRYANTNNRRCIFYRTNII